MLDSLTLTSIILAEVAFVLLLGCAMLTYVLMRERREHQRLLRAYQRLRNTIRADRSAARAASEQAAEEVVDPVSEYFAQAQEDAHQRYRNITQTKLPRLAPEHPFNAKVAALRFMFCQAEARAYRKSLASGDVWVLLERQLYDIARWIVDREDTKPSRQRNNQVKLLQQRVEKLKGFEKLSRDLQRKLELNQQKREELERLQEEHQSMIDKLQRINNALSLAQELPGDSAEDLRHKLQEIIQEDRPTQALAAERRLTNIEHFSVDNQRLNSELTQGLRAYNEEYPHARSDQLESTIKRLEAELYRSERHVAELKQQHRSQGDGDLPASEALPPTPSDSGELETVEGRASAMGNIEDTLKVIHTNMANSTSALSRAADSSRGPSPYSLGEIQQLRGNNVRQRNLIVDLESELNHLRDAIPHTEDLGQREQQELEVLRLERLVKECEHCILALESEVEMLYNQLQERQARLAAEAEAQPTEETVEKLQQELETLSERLLSSQQDTLLKQFALDSLKSQSIEEIARALFGTLKRAELIAGFVLNSKVGNAEYFPAKHFLDREKAMLRRTTMSTDIAYVNEGILFAGKHMHLMLKKPPENEQELSAVEKLLHSLLELCGSRIDALELHQLNTKHNQHLDNWASTTHNTLVNMEISYAYQAEEAIHLLDELMEQLKRAGSLANTSEAAQAVIDNALNECQHRFRHLFVHGSSIDESFNQLLGHLDQLPKTQP